MNINLTKAHRLNGGLVICDVLAATHIGDTAATSAVLRDRRTWIFCVHGFTF